MTSGEIEKLVDVKLKDTINNSNNFITSVDKTKPKIGYLFEIRRNLNH